MTTSPFKFYSPANNPSNFTSPVGGAIDTTKELTGILGELLITRNAAASGSGTVRYQYRKVYLLNNTINKYTTIKTWISEVEVSSQISIGIETSNNQSTTNAETAPTGVTFSSPSDYVSGLSIGNLNTGASIGIWIKQTITDSDEANPYITFNLSAAGVVS
jgi:hypothetical protein